MSIENKPRSSFIDTGEQNLKKDIEAVLQLSIKTMTAKATEQPETIQKIIDLPGDIENILQALPSNLNTLQPELYAHLTETVKFLRRISAMTEDTLKKQTPIPEEPTKPSISFAINK